MNVFPGPLAADLRSRLLFRPNLPGVPRGAFVVAVERPIANPQPEPGGVITILTHDSGVSWTTPYGEKLARCGIEQGGPVYFCFVRLADAIGCQNRLDVTV